MFGQGGSFTSNIANNGGVSADSLNVPIGVAVDPNGNLYIADTYNFRVLEYNTPLSTDTTADLVFGQGGSFTSADRNKGGVSADSLNLLEGVAVDASGNVYIADTLNFRVLEYNTPLSTDTTADLVFGQRGSFTSTNFACLGGANSLCDVDGVAMDPRGNVYIADWEDSRVLEYDRPLSTNTTADAVFGQGGSFTTTGFNHGGLSANSLSFPQGVAVDANSNLYIADTGNNRVLIYKPTTAAIVASSLAFGPVAVGQTATRTVTVYNTGTTNSLIISSATSSDPEYAASGTGTCGPIPVTVTPGTSCTFGISFSPNGLGAHSAILALVENATNSPQHVSLSGTGIAGLTTSASSLAFPSVRFGLKGAKTFGVTNHQTQPVSLSEGFSGTNAADFAVTGGSCSAMLAAKGACTITVSFTPSVLGTESATVVISDSPDPLSPYSVALSTGPTLPDTVVPATLSYGTVSRASSKTLKATVTNYSPYTLSIGSGVSGTNAGDFTVTGGTCGPNLAGNSSCTIAVTFKPTTSSAESATLAVGVSSDPSSPHNVTLTGTGS